MSHTPGPWKLCGDIIVGAPEPVPNLKVEPYGKSVAKIHWDYDGDCGAPEYRIKWKPEGEANAALIAAAPEMKQALGDLLEWATLMGGWDSPAWERAQQAYNKAEGR